MTFWNRVYCLLGLWTYILYQIHEAAFCKYTILDIIGTKSLPYPRLITTCMEPEPVMVFTSDQIS